ncbi:MAG: hypothetical protein ACC618_04445 [Patescibacteria group bacterium]
MVANTVVEVRYAYYRWYHTDFRISNTNLVLFEHGVSDYQEGKLKKIGGKGSQLVRGAFEINGVERVYISPFTLSIAISRAVRWEDVEKKLFELFKSAFGIKQIKIHRGSLPKRRSLGDRLRSLGSSKN